MKSKQLSIFVGEKIKHYRQLNKMTQTQLAEKIGVAKTTISGYEKGYRSPMQSTLFKIADVFNISIDDLFPPFGDNVTTLNNTSTTIQENTDTSNKILNLGRELQNSRRSKWIDYGERLLEEQKTSTIDEPTTYYTYDYYDQPASAGTGQYLNDVQVETIDLPVDINADFVVPIYGDSMEPDYSSGDYIFVKLSVDLSDGDIGVFEYYGDAYIKQLVINDSGAFLHSLNDKYSDIQIDRDSDFRIIGEVVGSYTPKS
ncbi:XRE family transcriptional regulator [Streptococcus agalactiae]|uniref:XRE family transcriptional regulator n=1 Tax=Streptococcus agalactiae TaxID=1311 RepID=UPI0006402C40|nr:XRE family transcriptional regulator [Streptococcus agalactiae]AWZ27657.1 phage repressor protein [Streptococcus agalactiae]KLK67730.1 repressor [Streptococcus agalactiae]